MMDNIIASDQLTILYKPNTSYIIYTLHSKTKGIKHARFFLECEPLKFY